MNNPVPTSILKGDSLLPVHAPIHSIRDESFKVFRLAFNYEILRQKILLKGLKHQKNLRRFRVERTFLSAPHFLLKNDVSSKSRSRPSFNVSTPSFKCFKPISFYRGIL